MPLRDEWSHFNPVRVHAGPGIVDRIAEFAPTGRLLLLTSAGFTRRGTVSRYMRLLGTRAVICDAIQANPELDDLDALGAKLRRHACVGIVALGGGSVIDAAKALSLTLPGNQERPLHRVLREGEPQKWVKPLPLLAIPTTAGTGAEVTPFATVWDRVAGRKHSLADAALFPRVALLDAQLTLALPARETLYTGLDTFSHALESLWNKRRTPVSQACAVAALELAVDALPAAIADGTDVRARARMQQASLLAGLAICQNRTAVAHSISYPLTLHCGVPHGLACGFTLAAILGRMRQHGVDLGATDALLDRVERFLAGLDLPILLAQYAAHERIQALEAEMIAPGRAENFLEPVDGALVAELLQEALGGSAAR